MERVHKLLVVNFAVAVEVELVHEVVDLRGGQAEVEAAHGAVELGPGHGAVAVPIHALEGVLEAADALAVQALVPLDRPDHLLEGDVKALAGAELGLPARPPVRRPL